eukprot:9127461-Karenia_brevis.AAC.1
MTGTMSKDSAKLLVIEVTAVTFKDNAHREGSGKFDGFERAKGSKITGEVKITGASLYVLKYWLAERSY